MKKNNNQSYIIKGLFIGILIVFNILSVSASFDIAVEYATPKCLAKSTIQCSIDKTKLEICNQFGSGFETLTICKEDEECGYDGSNKCIKKGFEFPKIDDRSFLLLSLILVIVITIAWYFMAKNRLKNKEVRKSK